jgi:RND family efflux transporter MFP subunit
MANPGTPVFTLVELDPVEIQVGIPETDIRLIHRGQKAIVTASALPGTSFLGQVQLVNVSAEPQTRTYMARIRVPNRETKLLVGMITEARIVGDGQIDVLTLPGTSIVRDPQGATQVYVYFNEKKVYARRVVTAGIIGQDIQIVDGIKDTDWIVVAGRNSCVRAQWSTPKRCIHEPDSSSLRYPAVTLTLTSDSCYSALKRSCTCRAWKIPASRSAPAL